MLIMQSVGQAASTPNTGVKWRMSDLVANFPSVVTGSGTNYFLLQNVVVSLKDTLTIEPGTVITRAGAPARPTLAVLGRLVADGTRDLPILITSVEPAGCTRDYCLSLAGFASNSIVNWVICERAHAGIRVSVSGITLSNCLVRECNLGFYTTSAVTFEQCRAENNGSLDCPQWGVGAYCNGGSPVFRNCIFTGNRTGTNIHFWSGGGIGMERVVNARIEGCTITNNRAQFGAGVVLYECNSVTVVSNRIHDNRVMDDTALHTDEGMDVQTERGTGLRVERNPRISRVYFYDSGGAIVNNVFDDPLAVAAATAGTSLIAHNLFPGVAAPDSRTGVYCWDVNSTMIANNIFGPGFVVAQSTTNARPTLRNNLFEPNPAGGYFLDEDTWLLDVDQINALPGNAGNFVARSEIDPGNLNLPFTSPCLDAGVEVGVTNDLRGEARPLDGRVKGTPSPDVGPVEAYPLWLLAPTVTPSSGGAGTEFGFTVDYRGSLPSVAHVVIDGETHAMELAGGAATNGTYQFRAVLPWGAHQHHFLFEDAAGRIVRSPASGSLMAPLVNDAPLVRCREVTVPIETNCAAIVSIDDGSSDPDALDTVTLAQDPPSPYPVGETWVTLTATDTFGASASCTSKVTVLEFVPPTITCPSNIVVDAAGGTCASNVAFVVTAADDCAMASVTCRPPSCSAFRVGTTRVNCVATDAVGNTNSCAFDVTVRADNGSGWALAMDGLDDYVAVPHRAALNALPLTITAWINTAVSNRSQCLVSKYSDNPRNGYQVVLANGEPRLVYWRDNVNSLLAANSNSVSVADGWWHHLAYVVDTNGASLFVDGNFIRAQAWTGQPGPTTTTQEFRLGRHPQVLPLKLYWQGLMDEVAVWNVARTPAELQAGLYQPLTGSEPGLIAYWRMNDGTGTMIADATTNHFDGTLTNGTGWVRNSMPAAGSGLALDGEDDFVRIPGFGRVMPTNEITVEFWLKPDAMKDQVFFALAADDPANRLGAQISVADGSVWWDFGNIADGGRLVWQPAEPITICGWQHLALVASQSGAFMRIYRNGVLEAEQAGAGTLVRGNYDLILGGTDGRFTAGVIDEFRIWNVPRSAADLRDNMHRHLRGTETGLLGCWRFDEGAGNTAGDSTGKAGAGFLANHATWAASPIPLAPDVVTLAAGAITLHEATLNGWANPNAHETTAWFEWGTSTNYDQATPPLAWGIGSAPRAVTNTLTGLAVGVIHHYRVVASNDVGISFGADQQFLPALPPQASTQEPSEVVAAFETAMATLHGTAIPNGAATLAWFEWGRSTNYSHRTAVTDVGNGTDSVPVQSSLREMIAGRLYHCRIVVSNQLGIAFGGDQIFGTPRIVLSQSDRSTNECHSVFSDPGAELLRVKAISAGSYHALALVGDGSVLAWGWNIDGSTDVPEGLSNVVEVAGGWFHSLALKSDGTVVAWGQNTSAGLNTPPPGLANVVAIASGGYQNFALQSEGTLANWGANDFGNGLTDVVSADSGAWYGMALRRDGTVNVWGEWMVYGSGPFGIHVTAYVPEDLRGVMAIAGGANHCLALKEDGTAVEWGHNYYRTPPGMEGMSNLVAVSAGDFDMALARDGTVVVSGSMRPPPEGLSNIVAIAAARERSYALRNDGAVITWDISDPGQTNWLPELKVLAGTIIASGNVDTNRPGIYTLTYTATNELGGIATATRTVVIADTMPPRMSCPTNVVLTLADGTSTTNVEFAVTARDDCEAAVIRADCRPPSGSPFAVGTTVVECIAADSSGHTNSCAFAIRVNTAPIVSLITPTNQSVFVAPAMIPLLADAIDPDGDGVAQVDYFAGANHLGLAAPAHFLVWSNAPVGSHSLTARATDGLGLAGLSAPVQITVLARPPLAWAPVSISNFNRQSGLFLQTVHVTNPGAQPLAALRLWIALDTNSVAHHTRVWNAAGVSNGVPFVLHNQPLASGQSIDLTIEYYIPDRRTMPDPIFTVEVVPADPLPDPVGKVVAAREVRWLTNGTVRVDFLTSSNRIYYLQYSPDLMTWKTALPSVLGNGHDLQWLDTGPPKTDSAPQTVPSRFYRIILLP